MRFLRHPRRIRNTWRDRETTARIPWHNDFYVVEFPKSGITWLSTILANVALIESGRKERASYSAVQLYVPDIHVTRDVGPVPYDRPPVRFIKSHAPFNLNYVQLIYLVRHPLDVMKSYFRIDTEKGVTSYDSFDAFCRSEENGVPAWRNHVRSWLVGRAGAQRLHLCRYEELRQDAFREISRISDNFGWNISGDSIRAAIEDSSMENMKEGEQLYRSRNPRHTMTFVGGQADFEVEEKTRNYIDTFCADELALLGYTQ
jgi:hypothetical protein